MTTAIVLGGECRPFAGHSCQVVGLHSAKYVTIVEFNAAIKSMRTIPKCKWITPVSLCRRGTGTKISEIQAGLL
jgi:hypothetical protein